MNHKTCDRCGLEIIEDDEGVPLKRVVSIGEDDETSESIEVAGEGEHTDMRLHFVVVDEDDEPADVDFCASCVGIMVKEHTK